MIYRAMLLSLTASALVVMSVVAPAQADDSAAAHGATGLLCGGSGYGSPPVFNFDRSVNINRSLEVNRNFNFTRNTDITKNFDFSKNIEINRNFDFSRNIEINKHFGIR